MKTRKVIGFLVLGLLLPWGGVHAGPGLKEGLGIEGDWQTRDYSTKQPSSIIHIWQAEGRYFGKIKRVYPGQANQIEQCTACQGWQHNNPIIGLLILEGLVQKGKSEYENGRILDPRSGKLYQCKMELSEDGRELKMRAYLGFSLIGATDVWYRFPVKSSKSHTTP